jgi:hypothetical protein
MEQTAKQWREKHGLTQREAGAIFGWSQPGWLYRETEAEATVEFQYALAYLDEHPELIQQARIEAAEARADEKTEAAEDGPPKGLRPAGRAVWEMAHERRGRRIPFDEVPSKLHAGAYELVGRRHAKFNTKFKKLWLELT